MSLCLLWPPQLVTSGPPVAAWGAKGEGKRIWRSIWNSPAMAGMACMLRLQTSITFCWCPKSNSSMPMAKIIWLASGTRTGKIRTIHAGAHRARSEICLDKLSKQGQLGPWIFCSRAKRRDTVITMGWEVGRVFPLLQQSGSNIPWCSGESLNPLGAAHWRLAGGKNLQNRHLPSFHRHLPGFQRTEAR